MEFVLLIVMAGVVGWLLWQLTAGAGDPTWAEGSEIEAPAADADIRSLHTTPDERSHPVVAATLLALSVLVVAFGIAAGVFWAGRFLFGQLGQMLGL